MSLIILLFLAISLTIKWKIHFWWLFHIMVDEKPHLMTPFKKRMQFLSTFLFYFSKTFFHVGKLARKLLT